MLAGKLKYGLTAILKNLGVRRLSQKMDQQVDNEGDSQDDPHSDKNNVIGMDPEVDITEDVIKLSPTKNRIRDFNLGHVGDHQEITLEQLGIFHIEDLGEDAFICGLKV